MSKSEMNIPSDPDIVAGSGMLRLGWMFYGPLALLVLAVVIATNRGFHPAVDAIFWATVAACIGLRYMDIKRMNGRTVRNKPATLRHWRRYTLFLTVAVAVVWGAAHGIAYLSR